MSAEKRVSEPAKEFTFLFVARSPCGNLHETVRKIPKPADLSDGDITYYWDVKRKYLETAVRAAEKKAENLSAKTGLDWELDDDATLKVNGETKYLSIVTLMDSGL